MYEGEKPTASSSSTTAFIPRQWTPKISYPKGAFVSFAGCYWRCEMDHTSDDGEAAMPSNNLHLWTPFAPMFALRPPPGTDQPPSYGYPYYPTWNQSPPMSNRDEVFTSDSEDDANWTLLDRKGDEDLATLRLEIAQEERPLALQTEGLVAELRGDRVWKTAGIGLWTYCLDANDEQTKNRVWSQWADRPSKDAWIKAAGARTRFYNDPSQRPKPVAMWKLVENGQKIPSDAIPIGHEADGQTLFAARALYAGGLHPGKASHTMFKGSSISFAGQELPTETFEVLCGPMDPRTLQWKKYRHGERGTVDGWQPVEGGREADGRALLLARAEHAHGLQPGKIIVGDDHACLGYGGGEVWVRPFEILAYATKTQ